MSRDSQQLLQLASPVQGKNTLLEVLGYDVDVGGFLDMMQIAIVNDAIHISQGGQTIGQNQGITINLTEDIAIHDLKSLAIGGTLAIGGDAGNTIWNAASLFRPLSAKIGGKQFTFGNDSNVYTQYRLGLMNTADIEPLKDGLWMPHQNGDAHVAFTTYEASIVRYTGRATSRKGATGDSTFLIPLHVLFPFLRSFDNGALWTGRGQTIQFNLQTVAYNEAVVGVRNVAYDGTFTITNLHLVQQYARLPPPQVDMILKSEFTLHPIIVDSARQKLDSVVSLTFNVSKGERLKSLIFGFSSNQRPANVNVDMDTWARFSTANAYTFPASLFPKFAISGLELDAGGDRVVLSTAQLQILHHYSALQSNDPLGNYGYLYQDFIKDMRQVYKISLDRLPEDFFGSTSKAQVQVSVKISVSTATNLLELTAIAGGQEQATLNRYDVYAFLEKTDTLILKAGLYQ